MSEWYLARGAGLAALVLLSVSTMLGALVSAHGPAARRYVVQYVHRVAAALGLTVLVLHIGLILADSYARVGWVGALVPFASGYRPGWVALGTLGAYLFLGVALLGLARGRLASSRLGAATWRGVHALAYAGWLAAMFHGFFSGSDSDVGWTRVLYLSCLIGVLGATAWRLRALRCVPVRPPIATSRITPSRPVPTGGLR